MLTLEGVFNESFYLAKNPDVAEAIAADRFASGSEHFNLFGQIEQRNPRAMFSHSHYLADNPDVAAAVVGDAITGIQQHGQFEGRRPRKFYNDSYYLAQNSDVAEAVDQNELTGIKLSLIGDRPSTLKKLWSTTMYYRARFKIVTS